MENTTNDVEDLIKQAVKAGDANEALKFSQAALNVANANAVERGNKQNKGGNP